MQIVWMQETHLAICDFTEGRLSDWEIGDELDKMCHGRLRAHVHNWQWNEEVIEFQLLPQGDMVAVLNELLKV